MKLFVAPLLFAFSLSISHFAKEDEKAETEADGSIAPANCWYTEGGNVSHSGATKTRPIVNPVQLSWEYPITKGEIEGEPIVWDQRVVLCVREKSDQRSLIVLNLQNGKPAQGILTQTFRTNLPLSPSLWGNVLLVRVNPTELRGYRLLNTGLSQFWSYRGNPAVSKGIESFLFFRNEVYVSSGYEFYRLALGSSSLVWKENIKIVGKPALHGDCIYVAARSDTIPEVGISKLRRLDGKQVENWFAPGAISGDENSLVSCFPNFIALTKHAEAESSALPCVGLYPKAEAKKNQIRLSSIQNTPALTQQGWFAKASVNTGEEAWVQSLGNDGKIQVLINNAISKELMASNTPASCARDKVYLGNIAFDCENLKIECKLPGKAASRWIPARATLLRVEGQKLVAYRESKTQQDSNRLQDAALKTEFKLPKARAVFRDGTVFTASNLNFTPEGKIVSESPKASWKLDELVFLEDEQGNLKFAPSRENTLRATEMLNEKELANGYANLAVQAASMEHPQMLAKFLAQAWLLGASDSRLGDAEKKLALIAGKASPPDKVEKTLTAAESKMIAEAEKKLCDRVERLPEQSPRDLRFDLLRTLITHNPTHEFGQQSLRKLLPSGLQVPDPFEAEEWLDYLETAGPAAIDFPKWSSDSKEEWAPVYKQSLKHWRSDLSIIRSPNLLVISPLKSPGRIARCLALGELVCSHLEKSFFPEGSKGKWGNMILLLYETQKEYLKQSEKAEGKGGHLEWTSGHYNPQDDLERAFLPSGEEAFERVMSVYAHELTHHWCDRRLDELGRVNKQEREVFRILRPGYWIVEGFASLVQGSKFDFVQQTITPDPHTQMLDLLANSDPSKLIDWKELFLMNKLLQAKLNPNPKTPASTTWSLGGKVLSDVNFYYVQSASACHYLYLAENGKYRKALLKYVKDYYSGNKEYLDVEEAFGMSSQELGKKVIEFAKISIGK